MPKHSLEKEGFYVPLLLVAAMVIIHLLNLRECYGVIPRTPIGLRGILLAPFFHSSWEHLFNNCVPLFVLCFIIFNFYKKLAYILLTFGWFLTGLLVWLFGNLDITSPAGGIGCHIGASGIIYLLAFFILSSGLFRRSLPLISVSLIIVFLYGSMVWGIFPQEWTGFGTGNERISWESHLSGALVGLFFAYKWRKIGLQRKQWAWERQDYHNPKDEDLWQRYLEMEARKEKTINPEKYFSSQQIPFDFIDEDSANSP